MRFANTTGSTTQRRETLNDRAQSLTDDEGALLALVLRAGPLTAYQIAKIYEGSPVSNFNTSKGKLYPLIKRLRGLGLLDGARVEGDARGTETISATDAGREAVRNWIMQLRPSYLLLDDPLRTKVQSFDLLSKQQQLEWIVNAKAGLQAKLDDLQAYAAEVEVPYHDIVHDNAVSAIRARMEWLDRLLHRIVTAPDTDQPSGLPASGTQKAGA